MFRKNILITGASSGLGEEMARMYAAKGHNLALCARRLENLETLRNDLAAKYPSITIAIKSLDVCDYDQVFVVFREFQKELGSLDRIIVNAGMGKGASLGTGYFKANRQTAETNFIAAIAQCEAAMEIFREQNAGHLVTISSMSALRGLPGSVSVYSASKAALRNLTESIRVDMMDSPIAVSCILPGFILTPINERRKQAPFRVDLQTGCRAIVKAIDKEVGEAKVPAWPWVPLGWILNMAPLWLVRKLS